MLKIFNQIKKIQKKKNQKGFTLLETLVAIFILTLSITGPVYISSVAFKNTIESRDNISAQYLAEEVIEFVKNSRDRNALQGDGTIEFQTSFGGFRELCFNDSDSSTNKCILKRNSLSNIYTFEPCSGQCPNMSFSPDSSSAVYGSSDVANTSKFIREFYFQTSTSNPNEVKLIVVVKWEEKGTYKTYTLSQRFYDIDYKTFFSR